MRRLLPVMLFSFALGAQITPPAPATPTSDWPQFFGPARNGVYTGPAISEKWPAGGPKAVWKKDIGEGFAGPVVAQGHLVLFHRQNNREIVEAMDPNTGVTQWK